MSTEPTTEAGKEHLFHEAPAPRRIVKALVPIIGGRDVLIGMRHERFLEAVTAIESEAREQGAREERERLRAVIEVLPTFTLEKALAPYYVRLADVRTFLADPEP